MSGFPVRVNRAGFGPDMVDEKKISDPRFGIDAEWANLCFWNMAGVGRTTPLLTFNIIAGAQTTMLMAAWDGGQYAYQDVTGSPAGPFLLEDNVWVDSVTILGDGRIEVQMVDVVSALDNDATPLDFLFATASPIDGSDAHCSCVASIGAGGRLNLLTIGANTGGGFDSNVSMLVKVW